MDYRDFDTRLAAYALVVDKHNRALLALWNGGARLEWTVPGGGVEPEESVEEAALREFREETGYEVDLGAVLGVHSLYIPPGSRAYPADSARGLKLVRVIYDAAIIGGELTNEVDGSTDEARWVPIVEIPSLPRVELVDEALSMWQSRV